MQNPEYKIASFYQFKPLERLDEIRSALLETMEEFGVRGTVIIGEEGFNSTVSGLPGSLEEFLDRTSAILDASLEVKFSVHNKNPFRRRKVKIKEEIVTLRKEVDLHAGAGTHVDSRRWNELLSDPETLVLDTRNDYEVALGRFHGAIDPDASSFSELPEFVESELDPGKHKRIAMYCTGGIRCEKFAPYMKQLGFEEVYQLQGGILKYLEDVPAAESLWEGECFVFDERVSVDEDLKKGEADDPSFYKNRPGDRGE